jgi:hypothetical protein
LLVKFPSSKVGITLLGRSISVDGTAGSTSVAAAVSIENITGTPTLGTRRVILHVAIGATATVDTDCAAKLLESNRIV